MKVITTRDLIRKVVDRFREQYPRTRKVNSGRYNDKTQERWTDHIIADLQKLDLETCTKEEVNNIIGNELWTQMKCCECESFTEWVIEMGEAGGLYGSPYVNLCKKCVEKAYNESQKT